MPIYFDLLDSNLPLTLESIGNKWLQEDIRRLNGYPFYHWLQTEHGCGIIQIGETEIMLKEHCGILIAPFIPHSYHRSAEQWQTSFITFAGKLESEIHKIVGAKPYIVVSTQDVALYKEWIDQTIKAHERKQLDSMQLSSDCYTFLLRLSQNRPEADAIDHPLYMQYILPVIKEIETQYFMPLTAQSLAAARYVSPQYLSRLFRRFLGCSVYTYLTNCRIGKAKTLLVHKPVMEVQQIAYKVGYTDTSHFILMFRQKTGYTPSAFRRLHIGI